MVAPAPDEAPTLELGFNPLESPRFWAAMIADFQAHLSELERGKRGLSRAWLFARVVIRSPGFRLVLLYRLASASRDRLGPIGRLVSAVFSGLLRGFHGCSIAPTARIHGGLILPHPQGIVIGPEAIIGPRAWIFQNVTIGGSPGRDGLPLVGADARIFPGAVLAGPITLGRNVVVGANAVVLRNVAARSLVRSPVSEVTTLPERWVVTDRDSQAS